MCGVIGLVYAESREDLGQVADRLLRTLEYRGYDSTGAAIQGDDAAVDLRKGVGAPSKILGPLGVTKLAGRVLCGQVRWATFGAVDEQNAQPHVVRCKTYLYGAHNGNVTNCDALKLWLEDEGHAVRSDNDGEMVVHLVEHFFALALEARGTAERRAPDVRRAAMREAIVAAGERLIGGFAAVVVDPLTHTVWAIKNGSSLYFGLGRDDLGGAFGIASSDLSAVLSLTRTLVSLSAGEFVEFTADDYAVYGLADGAPREREPARSRLRAEDTVLRPEFTTFMAQEIAAQVQTVRDVVRLFTGGSARIAGLEAPPADVVQALEALRDPRTVDVAGAFRALRDDVAVRRAVDAAPSVPPGPFTSSEAALLTDLDAAAEGDAERALVQLLDAWWEREEVDQFGAAVEGFCRMAQETLAGHGRVVVVCCGSSYNAAKVAALFFDRLAHVGLEVVLPGEFRGQVAHALTDGDLVVAVTQSGETKDLVDVLDLVLADGHRVGRVGMVNNLNSTIALEKCDLVVPLRCGPEIAVPATKSFVNQLAIFYVLALRLGEHRQQATGRAAELAARRDTLSDLPALIERTLDATADAVEAAAQRLYLAPSMHILGTRLVGVAREGALKVREVVLNHTEGFEASEFKHGPNTILGQNTLYGPLQVARLLRGLGEALALGCETAEDPAALVRDVTRAVFDPQRAMPEGFDRATLLQALYADYPLLYVTGPDARDVALTVSQLNTHKIRGSLTVVIAEEDAQLRQAACKPPADNPAYRAEYIVLPPTGDGLRTAFSATVVLQQLALAMSVRKAAWLDALHLAGHGVHPDVPKNVSKSITVD